MLFVTHSMEAVPKAESAQVRGVSGDVDSHPAAAHTQAPIRHRMALDDMGMENITSCPDLPQ